MDTIIANLKQEQKQQLAELEVQLRDLQSKLEVERNNMLKERDADLAMHKQQIKELQGRNANHESSISYLDVSISEMNANIQDKNGLIEDLTKNNEALKEK
jgi:chromosome segregation ATPase